MGAFATTVADRVADDDEVALLGGEALAWELRLVESPAELDLLRADGTRGEGAVTGAMQAAVPGATDAEGAAAGISKIIRAGGALRGGLRRLGLDWGRPWIEPASTAEVRPGMCFAIERRIGAPGVGGANHENNVIVTAAGPKSLPRPRPLRHPARSSKWVSRFENAVSCQRSAFSQRTRSQEPTADGSLLGKVKLFWEGL